jgi:biopolymer transport protein ExbB
MSFDLVSIYHHMGSFSKAIAAFLAIMGVAALGVFIERLIHFMLQRKKAVELSHLAGPLIAKGDYDGALKVAEEIKGSSLGQMIATGLRTYLAALKKPGKLSAVELTRRELERKADSQSQGIRRGLSVLATVGSIAPFVGLLGTVVGIITAFQGIAKEGSGGMAAVSAGISEALIETAFGLLVAIPAVLAFNYLSGRGDAIATALDEARGELIDTLESNEGREGRARKDSAEVVGAA